MIDAGQANFFDRVYPSISQRLYDLERAQSSHANNERDFRHDIRMMELTIEQYKGKIQRIEQLLIKHGLIHLLKQGA